MSPRDITGKCAVKKCGKAYTERNYDTIGTDNLCFLAFRIPDNG
jgi:hypothetical protein